MKRGPELRDFADEHGLAMISIDDLVRHRHRTENLVERVAETRLPTRHGEFTAYGYRSRSTAPSTSRWCTATSSRRDEPVLTRVHSECLTGDVFGSQRCDCGPQLDEALERVAEAGRGVVVYLRGHEGRGIGLVAKLRGLRAAGRRPRHRRRQPRPRAARRRAALRRRVAGAARPRRHPGAAADQQPREDRGASRTSASPVDDAGAAHAAAQRPQPAATCAPSGTGWATSIPDLPGDGRRGEPSPVEPIIAGSLGERSGAPDDEPVDCQRPARSAWSPRAGTPR